MNKVLIEFIYGTRDKRRQYTKTIFCVVFFFPALFYFLKTVFPSYQIAADSWILGLLSLPIILLTLHSYKNLTDTQYRFFDDHFEIIENKNNNTQSYYWNRFNAWALRENQKGEARQFYLVEPKLISNKTNSDHVMVTIPTVQDESINRLVYDLLRLKLGEENNDLKTYMGPVYGWR